ncbi:zyxin [Bombina bombina]|uniref:zyxin n=1 Tax=Bombina bombina TaxID=8345 RepID=UPI00235AF746|nr:zyxin [Bombina bombina]XP_053548761.1 zyxin [Bombina bombina]
MDPAAPATRMTSSFTINISTPSFYNPQKKFAPVVPPKPKLNPFKASDGSESLNSSAGSQEQSSGPGIHRAFVGKVGEFPMPALTGGDNEDFVLPPPPPAEDTLGSPTSSFPPPPLNFGDDVLGSPTGSFPPPPPPDFPELFPPPAEYSFPSPPPLEETSPEAKDNQVIPSEDPISVVPAPPPAPPMFTPKPVPTAPSIFSPKPAAPSPVAPKPSVPFIPKASHTFSPTPVTPPSTQTLSTKPSAPSTFSPKPVAPPTFSPKPVTPPTFIPKSIAPPTFSPKPSSTHTFTPKPSAPNTFSPKPTESTTEAPNAPQKFTPQPVTKLNSHVTAEAVASPPQSGSRPTGFNFVQQREKPRVLEKPMAVQEVSQPESAKCLKDHGDNGRNYGSQPESVKNLLPQTKNGRSWVAPSENVQSLSNKPENGRSFGSQQEIGRNLGSTAQNLKPQPERFQNQRPVPDANQNKVPMPISHRQPEADQASGPQGLNMKEVEELEMLTQQLMREMDNQPSAETHSMDLCHFCGKGLSRTETVVRAGEHLYHVTCFTCSKCDQQLQGQQYYESEGRPLCEECYQDTLAVCAVCEKKITERLLRAMGKEYHPSCFMCAVCRRSLQGEPFIVDDMNQPHCVADYHRRYAPRCSVCGEPIAPEPGRDETVRVVALEKNFHMMCYKCEDCGCSLNIEADDSGCFPLDGHVLCKKCHTVRARAALS